ncbi:MAG TPA: hypothetical protein VG676_14570 [Chitinophagaceae bacterium]|jgi:hypothetical protein|nr:hypothetical protein [Chitinophagaceae bacterium]
MGSFLLDAGGAFLVVSILILFMAVTIVLEGVVLILFKIEKAGKAFLYSLMVNLASLGVGYIALPLIRQVGNQFTTSGLLLHWIFVFAITVVVEGFLLILLTKKKPREKVWLATVVMNLVSYAILILLFKDYGLGY